MKLGDLCAYKRIAIQCHDAPDADALASGFALHRFFSSRGLEPYFFYGGRAVISKPNLCIMVDELDIPVEYAPELKEWDGLLITVDCQYGSNNVQPVRAGNVAVIDHHPAGKGLPARHVIKPQLGSCATLVWTMLQDEGFVLDKDERKLALAMYYGLYTDTNGFAEARHPLDLNMRDALTFHDPQKVIQEEPVLKTLFTSNLSLNDLTVVFTALHNVHVEPEQGFALAEAAPCDPNLLGFISDLAIQVAGIDTVIAWTPQGDGFKFSVRSSSRIAKARDATLWLTSRGAGNGGGHKEKAGGWVKGEAVREAGSPREFFLRRLTGYLQGYEIIDRDSPREDCCRGMRQYRKKEVVIGFAPTVPLFAPGTRLQLRMLEGETIITAAEDIYIMVGTQAEVYFMRKAAFEQRYAPLDAAYIPAFAPDYNPTVSPVTSGESVQLLEHVRQCRSKPDTSPVSAKRLDRSLKVFPEWDQDNYLLGEPGDWLIMQNNNPNDLYVVKERVFPLLYEPA